MVSHGQTIFGSSWTNFKLLPLNICTLLTELSSWKNENIEAAKFRFCIVKGTWGFRSLGVPNSWLPPWVWKPPHDFLVPLIASTQVLRGTHSGGLLRHWGWMKMWLGQVMDGVGHFSWLSCCHPQIFADFPGIYHLVFSLEIGFVCKRLIQHDQHSASIEASLLEWWHWWHHLVFLQLRCQSLATVTIQTQKRRLPDMGSWGYPQMAGL